MLNLSKKYLPRSLRTLCNFIVKFAHLFFCRGAQCLSFKGRGLPVFSAFLFLISVFLGGTALAQEQGFGFSNVGEDSAECFNYYPFGKVDFTIDTDKGLYKSGESMIISGTVNNRHLTSPITDGSFLVQLHKSEDPMNEESIELFMDQKNILGNIIIPPNSSADVNFTYQLPIYLPSGKYALSIFLISAGRFNIAGLPFIPNVPGDIQGFIVEGSDELNLPYFNLEESFVNGIKYSRNLPAIKIKDNFISANTAVINPASFKQNVLVEKTLFHWDDVSSENFLSSEKESLSIAAGKQAVVGFNALSLPPGVYMIVFEAWLDNGAKTIFRIRFSLPGNRTRLIYSGFSSYPIKKGDKTQVISCFANETEADSSDNNDLEIAVSGNKESSSFSESHKIEITPSVGIVKSEYMAGAKDDLNIITQVSRDGEIIDKVVVAYRLKDFLPKLSFAKIITGIGAFIGLLIFVFWRWRSFLESRKKQITTLTILILSGFLFFFPGQSRADTVPINYYTFYINYLMPNEFGEEVIGRRAGISFAANIQLDLIKPGGAWEESQTQSYNLDRLETGEWHTVGGAFDSPPFKYYCNYGGGSELCKRDANNDGVKETKIIFNRVSLEDALSSVNVLSKIPISDFYRYGGLNKDWVKNSNPLCFSTPYFKDSKNGQYVPLEEGEVGNRIGVLCAMKRSDSENYNYTVLRNFKNVVKTYDTATYADDTFPLLENGTSIRLMWPDDGPWISNAEDMYFTTRCDYQDTYTTDNSKVSCSADDLNKGKTTCVVGNGFTTDTTVKISLARKFSNCNFSISKKVKDKYIASDNRGGSNGDISEETIMTADQPPLANLAAMSKDKILSSLADITINREVSVTVVVSKGPSIIVGECNISYTGTYSEQPASNDKTGCASGTYVDDTNDTSTEWKWTCKGSGGGGSDTCSVPKSLTTYNCVSNVCQSVSGSGGTYSNLSACNSSGCGVPSDVTTYSLTVNIAGDGSGYISNPSRTDSTRLSKTIYTGYNSGDSVSLTAVADSGSNFTGGWNISSGGNCSGGSLSTNNKTNDTCNFTMSGNISTTVSFDLTKSPGIPTGLSGSAGACGGNINLSWNSVSGATSYTLTRDTTEFSGITGTSYADSGLGYSASYDYKVKACDSSGVCSPYSSSVSVTSSGQCPLDYYSLTFKTAGTGSGYANFYVWRGDPWNDWNSMGGNLSRLDNNEQANIGKDNKFKLTAVVDAGSYFSSWSGCDSVSGNDCFLNENSSGTSKTATATFNLNDKVGVTCNPKVNVDAYQTVASSDDTTRVYWYSVYADSCTTSGGGNDTGWRNLTANIKSNSVYGLIKNFIKNVLAGTVSLKGIYTTNPIKNTRTYTVACSNGSGSATDSVTVANGVDVMSGTPTAEIKVFPNPVNSGEKAKIYWAASNIITNQCFLVYSRTNQFTGSSYYKFGESQFFGPGYYKTNNPIAGIDGVETAPITSDTTFKIRCQGYDFRYYDAQTTVAVGANLCGGGGKTTSPAVSITCDPVSCKGYKGVAAGNNGALKLSYSATDVDGDLNSATCKFTGGGGTNYNSCNSTYWPTSDLVSGSYTATMYAADNGNRSSNTSRAYTILEDIQADFDCSLDNSIFQSCSDIIAARNGNVYFKDKSTASGGASLNNWSWSFANGNPESSSKQNPDAKFTSTGSNNVTLTVTDSAGRTKSITRQIQAKESLKPVWREVIPR